MLAVMHGKTGCVEKLIHAGANVCYAFCVVYFLNWMFWIGGNFVKVDHWFLLVRVVIVVGLMFQILMFDSIRRRTCLHYAAYYGHIDCLKAILSAAHSTPVADSLT